MKIPVNVGLCLAAGILYNSWPLGYLFDSQTVHSGLASDLELVGHPYNWLFITGDVLTAVCIVTVAFSLLLKRSARKTMVAVAIGLLLFGLFTAVSALLPSQCTIGLLRCGADHGHGIGLDAVTSSLAALGLLISLASLTIEGRLKNLRGHLVGLVLLTWSLSGVVFAWLALTNHNALFAQDILMLLSGLALLVIGLNIDPTANGQK
jgi:hypothetical membrane protein